MVSENHSFWRPGPVRTHWDVGTTFRAVQLGPRCLTEVCRSAQQTTLCTTGVYLHLGDTRFESQPVYLIK